MATNEVRQSVLMDGPRPVAGSDTGTGIRVVVADIAVRYRAVEVPEVCPLCGTRLAVPTPDGGRVRELNLASANFLGAFGTGEGEGFLVDAVLGEEHPSDALWIPFGYECAGCGETLACGTIEAQ
jgi:hypothetical protein